MTSFYDKEELEQLGFKSIGKNVLISKKASLYGISRMSIGDNVRIDDFCVLSAGKGEIQIGNFVHIAVYSSLIGEGKIKLGDFSGISSKVSIYSSNDDYTGNYMTNPTVPSEFTNVTHADVTICKHALIGSGSVILPGVTLNEGAVISALSMVNKDCDEFTIYKGNPAIKIIERSRELLKCENQFVKQLEIREK